MIPSPHHSSRGGARVRLVVVHTAEGARTVESLGRFFQGRTQASSHVGIDDHRVEQYVDYGRSAWTLRSGNPVSDNAELCGFASWSRAEWLRHPRMLELAAQWIAERCRARGIPLRKLTPAQVAAGEAGVIGHHDWTVGKKEGSHWDPGPQFPWDLVMAKAAGSPNPGGFLMALSDHDQAVLLEAANAVLFGEAGKRPAGRTALAIDETRTAAVATHAEVAGLRAAVDRLAAAVAGDPVTADELRAAVREGIEGSTFRLTGAQLTPTTGEDPAL